MNWPLNNLITPEVIVVGEVALNTIPRMEEV